MKFLIVDDHPVLREGLATRLLTHFNDAEITEASNGQEAIEKATIQQPDLIIMDITMPLMTGIEATRQIKKINPATPIIMLSLHNDRETIQNALDAGANGYLQKTIERQQIPTAINNVMDGGIYLSKELQAILQKNEETNPLA